MDEKKQYLVPDEEVDDKKKALHEIKELAQMREYINENVQDLERVDRIQLLNMVLASGDSDNEDPSKKIRDKGDGCMIAFADITKQSLRAAYEFTVNKLKISDKI